MNLIHQVLMRAPQTPTIQITPIMNEYSISKAGNFGSRMSPRLNQAFCSSKNLNLMKGNMSLLLHSNMAESKKDSERFLKTMHSGNAVTDMQTMTPWKTFLIAHLLRLGTKKPVPLLLKLNGMKRSCLLMKNYRFPLPKLSIPPQSFSWKQQKKC